MKRTISNGLEAVVAVGLTCVDQGIDTKENVNAAILGHVARHFLPLERVAAPEDIPVAVLDRLHDAFGFSFEAHGGKLTVTTDCAPAARTA